MAGILHIQSVLGFVFTLGRFIPSKDMVLHRHWLVSKEERGHYCFSAKISVTMSYMTTSCCDAKEPTALVQASGQVEVSRPRRGLAGLQDGSGQLVITNLASTSVQAELCASVTSLATVAD